MGGDGEEMKITKAWLKKRGITLCEDSYEEMKKLSTAVNYREVKEKMCINCQHIDHGYEGAATCGKNIINFAYEYELQALVTEGREHDIESITSKHELSIAYYYVCDLWEARK